MNTVRELTIPTTAALPADEYGSGANLGAAFDTKDYIGEIAFTQVNEAGSGTNPTLDTKITHCATSGGSYSDVSGATFTQRTNAAAVETIYVDARALHRYVKVSATVGGSSTPKFVAAVIAVGRRQQGA